MFLARLQLNSGRIAVSWAAHPYRVHQRLQMAYEGDPRLLFRIEDMPRGTQILVQSHNEPDWTTAFAEFPVLLRPPEHKPLVLRLAAGQVFAFRLRANPTAKRTVSREKSPEKIPKRVGLYREEEQMAWLQRKAAEAGFRVLSARVGQQEMVGGHIHREGETHDLRLLGIQFDGLLQVTDPTRLRESVARGIGSGKGLGFGLLSLARAV